MSYLVRNNLSLKKNFINVLNYVHKKIYLIHFSDFYFQEAFLTTYRTFIKPIQLVEKLIDRFHRFDTPSDTVRQRVARESFSLLVRVIGDLT